MSSETVVPGPVPASLKPARSLFAIVVSTPSTHTLRVERLDASTALLVSSGRTIRPLESWLEAFAVSLVELAGPNADVARNLAAAGELRRRRKDG